MQKNHGGISKQQNTDCLSGAACAKITADSTPHASLSNDDANQAGSFFSMPPALSISEQIHKLRDRGFSVGDEAFVAACLRDKNYYRLRGYWMTLEHDGAVSPGTPFEMVWDIYCFDACIRSWLWDAIAPLEIKFRTQLAYHLGCAYGPLAYRDEDLFKDKTSHRNTLQRLDAEIRRAQKLGLPCVKHNLSKYGTLPVWAAVEVASMGTVSALYGNLRSDSNSPEIGAPRAAIAAEFGQTPYMLKSWMRHLTTIRNACAHHNRIYNSRLKMKPSLLGMDKDWDSFRMFPTFLILKRLYETSWPEQWEGMAAELGQLASNYAGVSLRPMGFPDAWREVLGVPETVGEVCQ